MKLRRGRRKDVQDRNADFDWRDIVCASEEAAKAEAEKQQALEDPNDVEWVYLKSEKSGRWLARRTPSNLDKMPRWAPGMGNPSWMGPGP
jgi:hypothetical protein